jgi:hypothetical protein
MKLLADLCLKEQNYFEVSIVKWLMWNSFFQNY